MRAYLLALFLAAAAASTVVAAGAARAEILVQPAYDPCEYARNRIKDPNTYNIGGIVGDDWLAAALCQTTAEACADIGALCAGGVSYDELDQLCTPGNQLRVCVPKDSIGDADGVCVAFTDGCPANAGICQKAGCSFKDWSPVPEPVPDTGGGVAFLGAVYDRPEACVYMPFDDGSPACGQDDPSIQIPPPPPTEHPCDEYPWGSKEWWCCVDPLSSECLPGDLTTPTGGTTTGGTTGGSGTGGTTGGTGGSGTGGTTTGGTTGGGPCDGIADPVLKACCEEHGGLTLEAVEECIPDSDDPSGDCNIIINVGGNFENNGQLNICCQYVNNAGIIQDSEIVQECKNSYGPGEDVPGPSGDPAEPEASESSGNGFDCTVTALDAEKASGKYIAVDSDGTGITLVVEHTAPTNLAGAATVELIQTAGPSVTMSGPAGGPFQSVRSWTVQMGAPTSMVGEYIPNTAFLVTVYGAGGEVLRQTPCEEKAGLHTQGGSGGCSLIR
jgi:hypothetical protein